MLCEYSDSPFVNEPNDLKRESVHIQVLGLRLNPHTVSEQAIIKTPFIWTKINTFFAIWIKLLPFSLGKILLCLWSLERRSMTGLINVTWRWREELIMIHVQDWCSIGTGGCVMGKDIFNAWDYFSHNTLIHQMIKNIQTLIWSLPFYGVSIII